MKQEIQNIIIMLLYIISVESYVHWTFKTAVILGENMQLLCNTSAVKNDCRGCSGRWYGGPDDRLLTYDEYSINTKYQGQREIDGFSLIIKNVTKEDINANYGCSFGFHSHRKKLQLQKGFELHPSSNTTVLKQRLVGKSTLYVSLQFEEVYPIPECYIYFNSQNLTSEVNTESGRNGLFYRYSFELYYDTRNHSCKGKVHLVCKIGSRNIDSIQDEINFSCEDIPRVRTTTYVETIIGVVGLTVILLLAVGLALCKFSETKRTAKTRKRNIPPDYESEDDEFIS